MVPRRTRKIVIALRRRRVRIQFRIRHMPLRRGARCDPVVAQRGPRISVRKRRGGASETKERAKLVPTVAAADVHHEQVLVAAMEVIQNTLPVTGVRSHEGRAIEVFASVELTVNCDRERVKQVAR